MMHVVVQHRGDKQCPTVLHVDIRYGIARRVELRTVLAYFRDNNSLLAITTN